MACATQRGHACLTKALTGPEPFPQSSDHCSSVPNWVDGFRGGKTFKMCQGSPSPRPGQVEYRTEGYGS
jgi:hypothetical protein